MKSKSRTRRQQKFQRQEQLHCTKMEDFTFNSILIFFKPLPRNSSGVLQAQSHTSPVMSSLETSTWEPASSPCTGGFGWPLSVGLKFQFCIHKSFKLYAWSLWRLQLFQFIVQATILKFWFGKIMSPWAEKEITAQLSLFLSFMKGEKGRRQDI